MTMHSLLEAPAKSRTADEIIDALETALPRLQTLSLEEERAGRLSDETVACLAEAGVFDVSIPVEYGGLALPTLDQLRVYAAAAKIAGSTGWVSWVTTTHVRWIAMFSQQARDEVYGLDWRGPRVSGVISATGPGKARPVEGGYMLQGKWPFCSGCRHTAWSILGAVSESSTGKREIVLNLVPTDELEMLNDWAVCGMKASGSNTVQLTRELFIPKYRTISLVDAFAGQWASEPLPDALYRNNFVTYTSALSGATPLGMAKGALDYYRARIDKRGITATDYKVQADAPVTHFQLVEAMARIEVAEMILSANAAEIDRQAIHDEPFDEIFLAKVRFDVARSTRACAEAIDILHRGSGASSIHENNPMQRYARDSRVATVHGQFNYETCAEDYGRMLCGKPAFGNFLAVEKGVV